MKSELDRKIAVAICETQPLMAEGLRAVLAGSGTYHLLDNARSLEEVSRLLSTASPRIMVVDKALGMPAVLDWLGRVRCRSTAAPIIWGTLLTESEALRLLKAGAKGIVRKTAPVETILACLDGVVNGMTWMEEALFREQYRRDREPTAGLTVREQQVLTLVEQGLRNKDIAAELGIRPGTVKIHLKHIFEKTGIRGRYGLALSGLRMQETPLATAAFEAA
jgi:DNA-binding NarL/FixJ family response regulator